MYSSKGKNYWIRMTWGNAGFGQTGSLGKIRLTFNQVNVVTFVPMYDTIHFPFPPTNELVNSVFNKPWDKLNCNQARIIEYLFSDIIFTNCDEKKGQTIKLNLEAFSLITNKYIPNEVLVHFMDNETFECYRKQLIHTRKKVYRLKPDTFPYPRRKELMEFDVPVYNFIDTFLRENKGILQEQWIKSLELDAPEF